MSTVVLREARPMAESEPAGRAAPPSGKKPRVDLVKRRAELAVIREARFQVRKKRIEADPFMDSRLKVLLLDREPLNTARSSDELGFSRQRLSMIRTGRRKPVKAPHPRRFLDPDTVEGVTFGVEDPGVEAGRVREWGLQTERLRWNGIIGKLEQTTPSRHGAASRPESVRRTAKRTAKRTTTKPKK